MIYHNFPGVPWGLEVWQVIVSVKQYMKDFCFVYALIVKINLLSFFYSTSKVSIRQKETWQFNVNQRHSMFI